jgi:hypothetical protein
MTREDAMNFSNWPYGEATLEDILSDSIIKAVMAADGVDPRELAAMLMEVGRNLSPVNREG